MKKKFHNLCYLLNYAWSKSKLLFLTTSLKNIFRALFPLTNVVGIGLVVDALTTGKTEWEIGSVILFYVIFNLAISLLSSVLTLWDDNAVRYASDLTQRDYMNDAIYINYHFAQDRTVLNLKQRSMLAQPVWLLSDLGKFLRYFVQFAGIAYIFSMLSPIFLLIITATSAVSVIISFKRHAIDFELKNNMTEHDRKLSYLYTVMTDLKYAKEIRIGGASELLEKKYQSTVKEQIKKMKVFFDKCMGMNMISAVMTVIQTVSMYLYFSFEMYSSHITLSEYTVLLAATTLLASNLIDFFDNIAKINKTLKYTDIFREYRTYLKDHSTIAQSRFLPPVEMNMQNVEITFHNVSFTYPETTRKILHHLNFTVRNGEKIGIVGLNGSGKTTLVKLLCRLYEPTEGYITLNGMDIRNIPITQYTEYLGIVLQDFMLFAYSVKENIVFDKSFDEKKFEQSIEKSGLKAKISSLNCGASTSISKILDENGIDFSGGEGQKLALARALYKDVSFLILDEPTSALDPIAEYELFKNFSDISEGKTTFFISHRLSSTRFCDRIFVLDDGMICKSGNHDELLQKKGVYAELYESQAKYYRKEAGNARRKLLAYPSFFHSQAQLNGEVDLKQFLSK